jgi:hypothetical protein
MHALRHEPCPRCFSDLPAVTPWSGFRYARPIWFAGVAVLVVLAPILASDIVVMIPLSVVYLFAGGPVLGLAQEPRTCRACGLALPLGATCLPACRPVPNSFSPRALKRSAALASFLRSRARGRASTGSRSATQPARGQRADARSAARERPGEESSGVRTLPRPRR